MKILMKNFGIVSLYSPIYLAFYISTTGTWIFGYNLIGEFIQRFCISIYVLNFKTFDVKFSFKIDKYNHFA